MSASGELKMMFTPARTSRLADACAAPSRQPVGALLRGLLGYREDADDDVSVADRGRELRHVLDADVAGLAADLGRIVVEDADDVEAVVGEDARLRDGLAQRAGADEHDVVLTGRPQDLA